jgi:hypothetical protein
VTMAVLIRRAEVGDGRQGGKGRGRGRGVPVNWQTALGRERPKTDGRVRRAAAMPRDRPNRGWGRGLTDGPRPQCRMAAPADRQARHIV